MENPILHLDLSRPFWGDYRAALQRLSGPAFPSADALSGLLPAGLESNGGQPIRFIDADTIPGVSYEQHIFRTGQVSTRTGNWHDLFNALVWSRFPRFKAAMNALHVAQQNDHPNQSRGRVRDALTLMDESGAIVVSPDAELLGAMARHDWKRVFDAGLWRSPEPAPLNLFVCGHALLEKFLRPYKAITAKVLLLQVDETMAALPREELLSRLDRRLAEASLEGRLFKRPSALSPLPLMGIPGWWPAGEQDAAFYADAAVFRPLGKGAQPAPVFDLTPNLP